MEKNLLAWSYWLGLSCFVVAILWKALLFAGLGKESIRGIYAMTFYRGGAFFLLLAIATTCLAWSKGQKT